jgi:AcrR family transcriptional regulator
MTDKNEKLGRSVRRTRKTIRDSLIELMKTKPIIQISVKEICDSADIGRSTFYVHYEDQYDLLRQIEDEAFFNFEAAFEKNKAVTEATNRDIVRMIEEVFQFIANNSSSIQVLISENGDIGFQKKLFRRVTMHSQQLIKKYRNSPEEKGKDEYYSVFIVQGSIALVQHWLSKNMDLPIPEIAKMLIKLTQHVR